MISALLALVVVYLFVGFCHLFPAMRFIQKGEFLLSAAYVVFLWPDLLRPSRSWFWTK